MNVHGKKGGINQQGGQNRYKNKVEIIQGDGIVKENEMNLYQMQYNGPQSLLKS